MEEKIRAHCRDMATNNMEVLQEIVKMDLRNWDIESVMGDTGLDIANNLHYNKGIRVGLRRVLELINKYGS